MAVLGMIHGPQAGAGPPLLDAAAGAGSKGGAGGAPEERAAAQTRWLDGSSGELFGGDWAGSVRRGASCDGASEEVRARVEAAKQAGRGGGSGKGGETPDVAMAALAKWNPNPDTPDPEKWGGRWGKPCGHNEVRLGLRRERTLLVLKNVDGVTSNSIGAACHVHCIDTVDCGSLCTGAVAMISQMFAAVPQV